MFESVNVGVKLPKKLLDEIDDEAREKHLDRSTIIRQAVAAKASEYAFDKAFKAFSRGEASLSKAAQLAGVSIREFASAASRKGFRYDEDAASAKKIAQELERLVS